MILKVILTLKLIFSFTGHWLWELQRRHHFTMGRNIPTLKLTFSLYGHWLWELLRRLHFTMGKKSTNGTSATNWLWT